MLNTTAPNLTPEYIANELGGALPEPNGSWLARCPVHPDKNPSLLISSGQRKPIVVHCRAGCDQAALINALSNLNLLPVPSKAPRVKKETGKPKKADSGFKTIIANKFIALKPVDSIVSFLNINFDDKIENA